MKAHPLLKQTMSHFVIMEEILANLSESVMPPKRKKTDPNALPEGEVARLNVILDSLGYTPLSVSAQLTLLAGMRIGEICGLRSMSEEISSLLRVRRHDQLDARD